MPNLYRPVGTGAVSAGDRTVYRLAGWRASCGAGNRKAKRDGAQGGNVLLCGRLRVLHKDPEPVRHNGGRC